MTPILQRMASALVEATPEWWTAAAMRVEVTHYPEGHTGMAHSIWSEQYRRDLVEPTDDIYRATHELQQLCERAGQPWSALEFQIEKDGDGWRFQSNFEYPGPKLGTCPND